MFRDSNPFLPYSSCNCVATCDTICLPYSSCNCRDTVATICFSILSPRTSKNKRSRSPAFFEIRDMFCALTSSLPFWGGLGRDCYSYVKYATLFFQPSRKPRCDGFRAMLSRNFSRSKVTLRCSCRGSLTLMAARVLGPNFPSTVVLTILCTVFTACVPECQ